MFHNAKKKRAETQSLCRRSLQRRISSLVRRESPRSQKEASNQQLQLRLQLPQRVCPVNNSARSESNLSAAG